MLLVWPEEISQIFASIDTDDFPWLQQALETTIYFTLKYICQMLNHGYLSLEGIGERPDLYGRWLHGEQFRSMDKKFPNTCQEWDLSVEWGKLQI